MSPTLPDGRRLILASTSPFRRDLLARLGLPFETRAPATDETPLAGEDAPALVARLARAKAEAVAGQMADALVIGSDQVAVLDGAILGKPGSHDRAVEQLRACAGRKVTFYTGLCLLDTASGRARMAVEPFRVVFRHLSQARIESYLHRERPYSCAGSFKCEGLGIALFERLEGDDPNALIGLPLIRLVDLLTEAGIEVL